jgi:hypothetical protein
VKANAHPDDRARCEAIRRSRACRTWTGTDGAWNLHVRHVPEVGAEIEALLAPFTHARFDAGRSAGSYEAREAYRADALLDLARASTTGSTPKGANRADTKVFVHIDLETLQSGQRRPGSTCHIDGVGPVDVGYVRSVLGEAFVVALIEDARDVRSVVHLGRQVTAHQRTALEARGSACERCGGTYLLDIDHIEGWALTHETRVEDLAWASRHCHERKTRDDLRWAGPPGNRSFVNRDGTPWRGPPDTEPGAETATEPAPAEAPVQDDLFTLAT